MSETDKNVYQLYGGIRLSGSNDGILVPVYQCHPRNSYFVATTGAGFQIACFQELDVLHGYVCRVDISSVEKTQFVVHDVSPVILAVEGKTQVIHRNDLAGLIGELNISFSDDNALIAEVVGSLQNLADDPTPPEWHDKDAEWEAIARDARPKAARLWLDVAIEDLDEKYGSGPGDAAAHGKVRVLLLSWAHKIAEHATSPIFEHFVRSVQRVEKRGVYVRDILATAIVNRVSEDVARFDKLIDLVRDFRRSYEAAPLSGVYELAAHGVGTLSEWADQSLENYYTHVKGILETADSYRLLGTTFVADGGRHWPLEIRDALSARADYHNKQLRSLLDRRQSIINELEEGHRDGRYWSERKGFFSELRSLSASIRHEAGLVDAFFKSLSEDPSYSDYSQRFGGVDYAALGLNRDFFAQLEEVI